MIHPTSLDEISHLAKGEIAFPLIDYTAILPLDLKSSTLQEAYTLISARVDPSYLEGLNWRDKEGTSWHNEMLEQLSDNIYSMIEDYEKCPSEFLMTKIFIWIQLWGGNSGRGIFVMKEKWPKNFNPKLYENAIKQTKEGNYISALKTLNQLTSVSTAFSTKHIHFWSKADAPIYDRIIGSIVFGRDKISDKEYPKYMQALDDLGIELNTSEISQSSVERNLFNWANTKDGKQWISLRLAE